MPNNLLKGAAFLLLGEFFLAVMAGIIKHLSVDVPHETMVFARNLCGVAVLMPLVLRHGIGQLKTSRFSIHLMRSLVGLSAMYCFFYVIAHMPLAEAALVKLTTPFFLPIIAFIWLSEKIHRWNRWAIVLGFIGVMFILRPGTENFQAVALIGLLGAALASVAKVCIRKMADTEPGYRIVFYFGFLSTLVSSIPLLWGWQKPTGEQWAWLLTIGVVGTLGQLAMTKAYQIANPGQVGPYTYASVVYTGIIGWVFWQEVILLTTLIGCAFIIASGLLNMRKS